MTLDLTLSGLAGMSKKAGGGGIATVTRALCDSY